VGAAALPALISSVFQTLCGLGTGEVEPAKAEPAVPIRRSVFSGHLVCLECGKSFKTLKRHLNTDHDLPPGAYRARWGLPTSYPMVAPDYAKTRSALARSIGLGRKRREIAEASPPILQVTKIPEARRGRRRKTA
jgi:predicted transcriptional regulator